MFVFQFLIAAILICFHVWWFKWHYHGIIMPIVFCIDYIGLYLIFRLKNHTTHTHWHHGNGTFLMYTHSTKKNAENYILPKMFIHLVCQFFMLLVVRKDGIYLLIIILEFFVLFLEFVISGGLFWKCDLTH